MHLTESTLQRCARLTFVLCCSCYLLTFAVPIIGRSVAGLSLDVHVVDAALAVMTFVFPLVGYLIARQQPRNAIGWVMLAVGLAVSLPIPAYADHGLVVDPGSLPAADVAAALTTANWAPVVGLIGTYLILLFPDGHLPSPRWRVVAWFSGIAIVYVYLMITVQPGTIDWAGDGDIENPLGVPFVGDVTPLLLPTIVVLPISFILCAAGLLSRFRRSSGVERRQLKWLATAGATVALTYCLAMLASLSKSVEWDQAEDPLWLGIVQNIAVFSFGLIPLAIGVAILKHGLYEIDIVINKAVVLASLAAFITVVYVAIVVGVGTLIGRGGEPNLALSVAATAIVAVAFEPVRHRVQRFANRLVYGDRATPYEVLAQFADRVGGSYDAAEVLPMMARTVGEGIGAASTEVWLVAGPGLVREATWTAAGTAEPAAIQVDDVSDLRGDRVVEVRHGGDLLGALTVTASARQELNPAEDKLLGDVTRQAGLVLRNVRLIEDLRSSRQRLVSTADEERRRLERNLHDGAQQSLVSVALMISTARARLAPGRDASLGPALEQAASQLRAAIEELRELARGIHPAILTERGLGPAIDSLAERSPVPVSVDYQLEERPPAVVEASLYFVVAEALTNIAKYAHATQASVRVEHEGPLLQLTVADDGIGGADEAKGSGLRGLADRVAAVDGTLAVDSRPGRGTSLTCTVPVAPGRAGTSAEVSMVGSV